MHQRRVTTFGPDWAVILGNPGKCLMQKGHFDCHPRIQLATCRAPRAEAVVPRNPCETAPWSSLQRGKPAAFSTSRAEDQLKLFAALSPLGLAGYTFTCMRGFCKARPCLEIGAWPCADVWLQRMN